MRISDEDSDLTVTHVGIVAETIYGHCKDFSQMHVCALKTVPEFVKH